MQMIAVDAENDIYADSTGSLAINTGLAACMQACAHAVKAQLGEMILAQDEGVPNFSLIWQGAPNLIQFEAAVRSTLLGVDGVTDVTSLTVTSSGGVCTYSATIQTTYGTGALDG